MIKAVKFIGEKILGFLDKRRERREKYARLLRP